ncbi:MAG TPA: DUF2335 domain-containing protein [Stellaceae bacterium]|nr:DUF2335 domain-containing protein [Stellaceae bacterium]
MSDSNGSAKAPADPVAQASDESSDSGADSVLEPIRQRVEAEIAPLLQSGRLQNQAQIIERVNAVVLSVVQEFFHGPLPHPSHFERYERAVPGSAARILKMAESEQQHRHNWEDRALNFEFAYSALGLGFGFLIGLGLIAAAVVAALYGHDYVAGAFVAASAIGMVTAFIKGRDIFGKKMPPSPAPSGKRRDGGKSEK